MIRVHHGLRTDIQTANEQIEIVLRAPWLLFEGTIARLCRARRALHTLMRIRRIQLK